MFQKIEIIGRLGNEPEAKATDSGAVISTFSVATSEKYKNKKGEKVEDTEWFRVIAWNKLAEICNLFLAKGSLVRIEGRLKTRTYTDKEGNERSITEVIASQMLMLGGNTSESKTKQQDSKPAYMDDRIDQEKEAEQTDDLPF